MNHYNTHSIIFTINRSFHICFILFFSFSIIKWLTIFLWLSSCIEMNILTDTDSLLIIGLPGDWICNKRLKFLMKGMLKLVTGNYFYTINNNEHIWIEFQERKDASNFQNVFIILCGFVRKAGKQEKVEDNNVNISQKWSNCLCVLEFYQRIISTKLIFAILLCFLTILVCLQIYSNSDVTESTIACKNSNIVHFSDFWFMLLSPILLFSLLLDHFSQNDILNNKSSRVLQFFLFILMLLVIIFGKLIKYAIPIILILNYDVQVIYNYTATYCRRLPH